MPAPAAARPAVCGVDTTVAANPSTTTSSPFDSSDVDVDTTADGLVNTTTSSPSDSVDNDVDTIAV